MKIETFTLNDLTDEFMSWFSDQKLMKYFTESKNKITKEEIISSFLNDATKKPDQYLYKVVYEGEMVGTIKIIVNKVHNIGDVAVLIGNKKYHLKGLGIEAIKLGSDLAINVLGLRKLFGQIYESNLGSLRAYTKAGWKECGRLKDYYLINGMPEDKILISYEDAKFEETKKKMSFNLAY